MLSTASFRFVDLSFRGKLSYIAHLYKAVFKEHHFWMEPLIRRFVDDDSVIFDVGAHSGQFTKLFSRLVPGGTVYAFEPGGYPYSILRFVMRSKRLGNLIVLNKALSSDSSELTLVTPIKESGTYRFGLGRVMRESEITPLSKNEPVEATSIDVFVSANNIQRLDFIKIDTEGWETHVLKGGVSSINRFHPTFLMELVEANLSCSGDTLQSVWNKMLEWGYRPYISTDPQTLVECPGPQDGDIFWIHKDRWAAISNGN